MRVVVVGAGAIGCLVGGRLATAGHQVTLVARPRVVNAISGSGLRINVAGRATFVSNIAAVPSISEAFLEFGPFDLALFTMKSYDTATAIQQLQVVRGGLPPTLSLQNGVGNEEQLIEALGAERVLAGVITTPASMPVPGVVRASEGGIGLAAVSRHRTVDPIARAFRQAGFETWVYSDWRALKWSKLLLNLIGNATCAILDWPPERVFADPRLFDVEWRAWQEALTVMRALGMRPVALPGYPLPWLVRFARWLPRELLQRILRHTVAKGRGGKMPSLHIDLERGRPQSEVTVLNGAVARVGQELGLPVPVNAALTQVLLGIASGEFDREAFRHRPEHLLAAIAGQSLTVSRQPANG